MMTSKITRLALIGAATLAAAIAIPATAQADPDYSDYQFFQSPSGNIRCEVAAYDSKGNPGVVCRILHSTYAGQCQSAGSFPWPQFGLWQGDAWPSSPENTPCVFGYANPPTWPGPTLDYGQKTRSFGAISCDSEQSGVTCTDSSTGHFFRVSQESYQLG